MPSVNLVGSSQIFVSGGGWVSPSDWAGEQIVGLDRHGRLLACEVSVTSADSAIPAFVGTKAAFAALAPDTALVDATGRKVEAAQIVNSGNISDLRLESVFPELLTNPERFWDQLASVAIGSKKGRVMLGSNVASQVIDRPSSAEALGVALWCRLVRDDGSVLLRRRDSGVLVWLLTFLRSGAERRHTCLSYDSLQHTGTVALQISDTRPVNEFKGACAFLGAEPEASFKIRWEENGWNPLCSGFVVAGAR